MPDISKCAATICPSRHLCWRFTAPANSYQTYSDFESTLKENDTRCEFFWDNKYYLNFEARLKGK